jgi:hypothetical protein
MPSKLPKDDFAALIRRAGLPLKPDQITAYYDAWEHIEPMLTRIRSHERGREAEPALIFRPEPQ